MLAWSSSAMPIQNVLWVLVSFENKFLVSTKIVITLAELNSLHFTFKYKLLFFVANPWLKASYIITYIYMLNKLHKFME